MEDMKNLIVVRPGDIESKTIDLSDKGKEQIDKLARFMRDTLEGKYYFVSSYTTQESADRLKKGLGLQYSKIHCFNELRDDWENYLPLKKARAIHEVVNRIRNDSDAENLILVCHSFTAINYPTYFMQKEFNEIRNVPISKGKGVLIDIVNKSHKIIPR